MGQMLPVLAFHLLGWQTGMELTRRLNKKHFAETQKSAVSSFFPDWVACWLWYDPGLFDHKTWAPQVRDVTPQVTKRLSSSLAWELMEDFVKECQMVNSPKIVDELNANISSELGMFVPLSISWTVCKQQPGSTSLRVSHCFCEMPNG